MVFETIFKGQWDWGRRELAKRKSHTLPRSGPKYGRVELKRV